MKAFIAYHYGADISQLFQLLKDWKIQFFDSMSDVIVGKSFQECFSGKLSVSTLVKLNSCLSWQRQKSN